MKLQKTVDESNDFLNRSDHFSTSSGVPETW